MKISYRVRGPEGFKGHALLKRGKKSIRWVIIFLRIDSNLMQDLILPQSQLQFGVIKMINARVVEIIIDRGVEVTMPMMLRCEEILSELITGEFGILLNEMNPHTYRPEAKIYQTRLKNLKAMAVVMNIRFTDIATKYLQSFDVSALANMKVFYNRENALEWLERKVG